MILHKAKAMPEGTHSVHGGKAVVKRQGKWVPDKKTPQKAVVEETKEPSTGEAPHEAYEDKQHIPKSDLPDDLSILFGAGGIKKRFALPKEHLYGGMKVHGKLLIVHDAIETVKNPSTGEEGPAFTDEFAVTEVTTGLRIPATWSPDTSSYVTMIEGAVESIEKKKTKEEFQKVIDSAKENDPTEGVAIAAELDSVKTHHHKDPETLQLARELVEATALVPGGKLSMVEIMAAAERWDVYLPNFVEEYEDGFTSQDWKLAFTLDITEEEMDMIPELRTIANEYGLDALMLGKVWTDAYTGQRPSDLESDIISINHYGNPEQGDLKEVVSSAVWNGLDLSTAWEHKFGELEGGTYNEPDTPVRYTNNGYTIPESMIDADLHGHDLTMRNLESVAMWCKGYGVSGSRSDFRVEYDGTVDGVDDDYYSPTAVTRGICASYEDMSRFTGDHRLFRGTQSGLKWTSMEVGDEIPWGAGSFTRDETETEKFKGGEGGVVIVIDVDEEHREEGLYGVDIDSIYNMDDGDVWADRNNIEAYASESEVVVRASHVRIKSISKPDGRVRVEPVYRNMELNKAIMDVERQRILEVMRNFDEIFGQSLGEQRKAEAEE